MRSSLLTAEHDVRAGGKSFLPKIGNCLIVRVVDQRLRHEIAFYLLPVCGGDRDDSLFQINGFDLAAVGLLSQQCAAHQSDHEGEEQPTHEIPRC